VTETSKENDISIVDGIKSIPIHQLEECIASAIENVLNSAKVTCHMKSLKISSAKGVKLKLELSSDSSDIDI